jgi:hypothetical protein
MSRLPLTASSMLGLLKKRFMSCEYVSPTGGRMGWGIGLVRAGRCGIQPLPSCPAGSLWPCTAATAQSHCAPQECTHLPDKAESIQRLRAVGGGVNRAFRESRTTVDTPQVPRARRLNTHRQSDQGLNCPCECTPSPPNKGTRPPALP